MSLHGEMSSVPSGIATKIIAAVAATLAAELMVKVLDRMGVSEETATLPREIIKAVAAVIVALMVEDILSDSSTAVIETLLDGTHNAVPTSDLSVVRDLARNP